MAFKILVLLLGVSSIILHFCSLPSSAARAMVHARAPPPVIHIFSAVSRQNRIVSAYIEAEERVQNGKCVAHLRPGEEISMRVSLVDSVHYGVAGFVVSNLRSISGFVAYELDRDMGQPNIFWRVNDAGIDLSYDMTNWKQMVRWP